MGARRYGIFLRVFYYEIASGIREEKFHISEQTCINLLIMKTFYYQQKADLIHDLKEEHVAIHLGR